MELTIEENKMLDGEYGPLVSHALRKTIDYGLLVEAERLCDVTMAHLFCGAHPYLEAYPATNFDEAHSEMSFVGPKDLVFDRLSPHCRCQSDVFPLPANDWEAMTGDLDKARLNDLYLGRFAAMGVRLVGTCVPYLAGFIPMPGEHYVSSESHAVLLMNSLWGACGHSDGIESGFWAAVCGKTPLWGLHDPAQRKGTRLYAVEARLGTTHDWDLFGHAAGLKIPPHEIPVFVKFPRPDIHGLKSAMASMATTSGVELSHFLGLGPEAPTLEAVLRPGASKEITVISAGDLEDSRAYLSCGRRVPVDYVSVGCPHLTIHQLGEVADFLGGRKVSANTVTHVWTAAPFKETADRSGITKSIESSGARLLTNTCPLVSGILPQGARSLAFDSGKQAHYMKSETDCLISYGSTMDCLKTALSGVWEGATG